MSDWQTNLDDFFGETEPSSPRSEPKMDMKGFIDTVAVPAFNEVADAMRSHGRDVTIRNTDASAAIMICLNGEEEMSYRVQGRMFPNGLRPYAEIRFRERKGHRYISVESMIRSGGEYQLSDVTRQEVIDDLLRHYMRRVKRD